MQDAIDAFADRLDLRHVGQIRRLEFFVPAEIGRRLEVREQEVRVDRRQQFAQGCADSAGSAGHQYAWHFFPRLIQPICGDWPGMIANQSARKRNNENSKCPMLRLTTKTIPKPILKAAAPPLAIPILPFTR